MTAKNRLRDYQNKRDFRRTGEPHGGEREPGEKPLFVIQKHDARAMHYDFRLEAGGVLKSWAVPKGPSTNPREKRLAVPTEDHPLEYADFEGVIPEGQYGGGTVLVWDTGTYRNLKEDGNGNEIPIQKCLIDGHVAVWLEGEKLTGGYALVRTGPAGANDRGWLLIKMKDDKADARRNPVSTQPDSVLTGRSLEQVAEQESRS